MFFVFFLFSWSLLVLILELFLETNFKEFYDNNCFYGINVIVYRDFA